jgi:hypothetical protein
MLTLLKLRVFSSYVDNDRRAFDPGRSRLYRPRAAADHAVVVQPDSAALNVPSLA